MLYLFGVISSEQCVDLVQLSFCCVVYPSVVITYLGQAAYLWEHAEDFDNTFYASIPTPVYWPMFVIATLAAIVASQVDIPAQISRASLLYVLCLCVSAFSAACSKSNILSQFLPVYRIQRVRYEAWDVTKVLP